MSRSCAGVPAGSVNDSADDPGAPLATTPLHLPAGYVSRHEPDYFADVEQGLGIWQPDVYTMAGRLAHCLGASAIVDLGCGRAAKLLRLRDVAPLIGVDYGANVET